MIDSDNLEDVHYPEPQVPGWVQAIELVATANEVGKALGWRRPTREENEAMSAAADACIRKNASNTPLIPGML